MLLNDFDPMSSFKCDIFSFFAYVFLWLLQFPNRTLLMKNTMLRDFLK